MIVSSLHYTMYSFLEEYEDLLKDDNFLYPPDGKKRLLLLHKCYSMVGNRMHLFLNKHNKIYRGYIDVVFPDDDVIHVKTEEELRKELVQFSDDLKHFFLNELPTYYHQYGLDTGVNFDSDELAKDLKCFKEARERGAKESSKFAKCMGVNDADNRTHNH